MSKDSNLVLVEPREVRVIMEATGLPWEEIAEPYPEFMEAENGCQYTFAWCMRREGDHCRFADGNRCTIYPHRPLICRTYPFMLGEEGELIVSECPGIGTEIPPEEARAIAQDLIMRKTEEDMEFEEISGIYAEAHLPPGGVVVIDSEGVKSVHE